MLSVERRIERLEANAQTVKAELPPMNAAELARAAGIEPDEWQDRLLCSTAERIILLCSRQSGKTLTTALLALHTALYQPDSLVLVVSRAERQSAEFLRALLTVYRRLGRPVEPEAETLLRLELSNGSRIVALPGREETLRSFSGVRLLIIDEAARCADSTYYSLRPMLAVSGGRLVLLSTPWGQRGFFHETWQRGEGWERYRVTAAECPRISATFLTEERAALGDLWYRQEYELDFIQPMESVFNMAYVDAAVTEAVLPLFDDVPALLLPSGSDVPGPALLFPELVP